jgi:hypothetical protein
VISGVNKEILPGKNDGENLLGVLKRISTSPSLDTQSTTTRSLQRASEAFEEWLNFEFKYNIYSANIGKSLTLSLTRKDAVYLIGNRCKHSLLRSNSILTKLLKIYRASGATIDQRTEILILEDIDNWLFDDFGGYHFTKLCELSAKVYHGIVQYVRPVYQRALVKGENGMYSYTIPDGVVNEDSKFEYYELLNRIRSPFLPAIETWEYLEGRY